MNTRSFIIATNGRLKWWLHHTLSELTPEQLHYSAPAIDDRPLMEVAMHAATILLGHAIVVGRRDWPVEDYPPGGWPPKIVQPASVAALVATLDALLALVDEVVSRLSDDDLNQDMTFPWGQQQAGDALSAALTHALTHAGGIVGMRAIGGFPVPPGY
jgi:DinB family protein